MACLYIFGFRFHFFLLLHHDDSHLLILEMLGVLSSIMLCKEISLVIIIVMCIEGVFDLIFVFLILYSIIFPSTLPRARAFHLLLFISFHFNNDAKHCCCPYTRSIANSLRQSGLSYLCNWWWWDEMTLSDIFINNRYRVVVVVHSACFFLPCRAQPLIIGLSICLCVYGCRDLRNRGPNIFIPVCDWWLTWWWSPLTYTLWFNLFDGLILWSTFDDDEDLNLQFTQMTAHHVCGKLFLGSALCSVVLSLVSFRKLQKLNEWMNHLLVISHFLLASIFITHCVFIWKVEIIRNWSKNWICKKQQNKKSCRSMVNYVWLAL